MPSFYLPVCNLAALFAYKGMSVQSSNVSGREITMLGFSMITLSFLIMAIFAVFFVAVIVTALQYEKAKRDDHRDTSKPRSRHEPLSFPGSDDSFLERSA